jgi:hypothetical protein
MGAPVIDRASLKGAQDTLYTLVDHKGCISLADALSCIHGYPLHVISRALNELLGAGYLQLSEDQYLQLGDSVTSASRGPGQTAPVGH